MPLRLKRERASVEFAVAYGVASPFTREKGRMRVIPKRFANPTHHLHPLPFEKRRGETDRRRCDEFDDSDKKFISVGRPWISRPGATGLDCHRLDRYPAMADLRCCDPLSAVRLADPGANPIGVRRDKLLQH
jgi:hypothetical protein